jgi:hypothetical protein
MVITGRNELFYCHYSIVLRFLELSSTFDYQPTRLLGSRVVHERNETRGVAKAALLECAK